MGTEWIKVGLGVESDGLRRGKGYPGEIKRTLEIRSTWAPGLWRRSGVGGECKKGLGKTKKKYHARVSLGYTAGCLTADPE